MVLRIAAQNCSSDYDSFQREMSAERYRKRDISKTRIKSAGYMIYAKVYTLYKSEILWQDIDDILPLLAVDIH